jgi:hypothetical protein
LSPIPGILQSPDMATTLWRNFGTLSFIFSNNCKLKHKVKVVCPIGNSHKTAYIYLTSIRLFRS